MSPPQVTAPVLTAELSEETATRFVIILSIGGVVPTSRRGLLYIFPADKVGDMIQKDAPQKFRELCNKIRPRPRETGPIAHLELSRETVKKTRLVVQLHPDSDSAKTRASVESAIKLSGIELNTDVSSFGGGAASQGIRKPDHRMTRERNRGVRR